MILSGFIAIVAIVCICKILHFSIGRDQWLGKWQDVLEDWDKKGYSIVKPLGYCNMCFAHLIAFLGFIGYVIILITWGADMKWFEWLILYLVFVPISSIANLLGLKWI